jgi:hypothetical protein
MTAPRSRQRSSITAAEIAARLDARPGAGGQWTARCRAHDDHNASLSIGTGEDGRVLLHCHAGCSFTEVCHALGIPARGLFATAPGPGRGKDWEGTARDYAENLDDGGKQALAAELGVPVQALAVVPGLGRGADKGGCFWTFPEAGFDGEDLAVVGITRRYCGSGQKKALTGSKRGLALPIGWLGHDGPLLVPEGWSDVLALVHAGLATVGRPSATGGANLLAEFLSRVPAAGFASEGADPRAIIVLAENDRKADGRWPGRDGATAVAQILADRLGRRVGIAFPPDGTKDARVWLTGQVGTDPSDQAWREVGQRFRAHIEEQVQWVEPVVSPTSALGERAVVLVDAADLAGTADRLAQVLIASPEVYALGGKLARVCRVPAFDGDNRLSIVRRTEVLDPVGAADLLSQSASFLREKGDGAVPCPPPAAAVAALLARDHVEKVRHLRGILHTPLLLPDGRLVREEGFDASTGWFVSLGGLQLPPVRTGASQEDARQAAELLLELVEEFPWRGGADRAAWLAYLLTLCCRSAVTGGVPLFLFDASTAGAGKSLLVKAAATIAFGHDPGFRNLPINHGRGEPTVDGAELRKTLTSIALQNSPAEVFDNVPQGLPLGGAALDNVLTTDVWKDRQLGSSTEVAIPWMCVLAATGNNVVVASDTIRRVVVSRLEPDEERHAERGGYRITDLPGHVRRRRPELLAAAIRVVKAYIDARRPASGLSNFGSFEGWSDTIRAAVHWAVGIDPLAGRVGMATVDDLGELTQLLLALAEVPGLREGLTSRQLVAAVRAAGAGPSLEGLRAILVSWCRPGDTLPSERSLGRRLRAVADRVACGWRLRWRMDRTGVTVWRLEAVAGRNDQNQTLQTLQTLQEDPERGVGAGFAELAGFVAERSDPCRAGSDTGEVEDFEA